MNTIIKICLISYMISIPGFAASAEALFDTVKIESAYVRGLPSSVRNTSAYMTIINPSDNDLVLVGASSDIADSIMLHNTENTNGMMSMGHKMSALIPAGGELLLESGGLHLMIMGLKAPLSTADVVTMTLLFQGDFEYTLTMPVRSVLDETTAQ
ncbi:copper chaperone PCu(A)C [Gammaproteobacteria bacterium]|nr:copper chaperone PCu(A)C [Gammaproteobacteria bacterium]